jgi:tetratricopeptide (TPR) repeat protein
LLFEMMNNAFTRTIGRGQELMANDRELSDPIHHLATLHEDAERLAEEGRFREAILVATEARALARRHFGSKHPDYAASQSKLAELYQAIGEYPSALPLFRQALKIRRAAMGRRHPDHATSLNSLAELYEDMGDHDKALRLYRLALEIRRTALGEDHPDYATSVKNLAALHQDMRDLPAARALYEHAVEICSRTVGQQHPDYAASLSDLAETHADMGDHAAALELHREALEIRRSALGENHADCAASLNNLAKLLHKQAEAHTAAVPPAPPAAEIGSNLSGGNSPCSAGNPDFSKCDVREKKSKAFPAGILRVRSLDRGPRLFPPIGSKLFEADESESGLLPDELVARRLLALARRPMTLRQRVLGWGLDPTGLLGRILWMFREGMQSELAGRCGMADFYWRQSRDALRSLLAKAGAWEEIIRSIVGSDADGEGLPDASGWARILVDEVFIDTHCGFFNGRVPKPGVSSLDHRAFDHVAAIEDWLTLGPTPPDPCDRWSLLAPPWELRLELARATRAWEEARAAVLKLRRFFPERVEYLDDLVEIEFERTTGALANSKCYPLLQLADAATMKEGIKRLQVLRREHPHCLSVFEALGKLYHLRAVELANANAVSEALVEARRALAHAPNAEGVETTIRNISEQLKSVIEQGLKIRDAVGRQYDVQLTPEARQLCVESSKGFQPIKEYLESGEPQETAKALAAARNHVLQSAVALTSPMENAPMPEAGGGLVALSTPPYGRRHAEVPFDFWLLSRRGIWLKVQAVAASIVLALGIGMIVHRKVSDRVRDEAFNRILAGQERRDYQEIVRGIEAFLAHPPLTGRDAREARVRELYDEAIVRLFVGQGDPDDPEVRAHVARYRKLTAGVRS